MTKRSPWSNPRWRRRSKRLRQNASCVNCGSQMSLQVHHLKYEKLFGYKLPLWMAWPWNLMVLCANCHSQVSRIHHAGKANHRDATKMVLGRKYDLWNSWQYVKWFGLPTLLALFVIIVMVGSL